MAADNAVNKGPGALGTLANQFNPAPGGQLGRTTVIMGTTALVGAAIATGGIAAPLAMTGHFAQAVWAGGGAILQGGGAALQGGYGIATGANWSAAAGALTAGIG